MSHPKPSSHKRTMRGVRPPAWSTVLARLSIAAILLLAPAVLAQPAGLPGFELERLELNPNGQGSLVVGSGLLLPAGAFRVSLAGHYENHPLSLYIDDVEQGPVVSDRVMVHVLAAWAPLYWLEVGAQLPVIAYQRGENLSRFQVGSPASAGLSTPSVQVRVGLLFQARQDPLDLALELNAGLPLGSEAALAREPIVRLTPRVTLGRNLGRWLRAGAGVGVVLRPGDPTRLGLGTQVDELGSAIRLGAVLATRGSGVRGELNLVGDVPLSRTSGAMEILAGLRLPLREEFELYALGGPGLGDAPGTPTFRLLLGLAAGRGLQTDPALRDDDRDGILNGQDKCPKEPGPAVRQGCPIPDRDKDGIEDDKDQCPDKAGPAVRQGCPFNDRDGDGIEDDEDKCPDKPGPAVRQGCPINDRDGDGIEDDKDKCPDEPGLAVRQGCPIHDRDGDGTEDEQDQCPDQPGPAVNRGCPIQGNTALKLPPVEFVNKSDVLLPKNKEGVDSSTVLDNVADFLRKNPKVRMRIDGHANRTGTNEKFNEGLSQRRADTIKRELIKRGVDERNLEAKGHGWKKPLDGTNARDDVNRRVEFIVINPESVQQYPERVRQ